MAITAYSTIVASTAETMPRANVSAGFFTSRMTSATISRPVKAIIASGIEKASAFQLGTVPTSSVRVSSPGWNATASPRTASSSWTPMSTTATTIDARYSPGRRIRRATPITAASPIAISSSPGCPRAPGSPTIASA